MFHEPTVLERLEAEARGRTGAGRSALHLFVESALIVAGFLLLGYILYTAQFSGSVRWFLGFLIVAAIAVYAWWAVSHQTSEPAPLQGPPPKEGLRAGELSSFAATVRRAREGLTYSQVLVCSRARDAFAERARLSRGLPPEGAREMVRNPEALRLVVRDPVLEEFLFLPSSDPDVRYRWVLAARSRGGFERELQGILDRMEAWR